MLNAPEATRTVLTPPDTPEDSAPSWGRALRPWVWTAAGALLILLVKFTTAQPYVTDLIYAQGIYRALVFLGSRVTGSLPYSLGEVIALLAVILLPIYLLNRVYFICTRPHRAWRIVRLLSVLSALVCLSVGLFYALWGYNFSRPAYAELAGWDTKDIQAAELRAVALSLTDRAAALRAQVSEDERGVFTVDKNRILREMPAQYEALGDRPGLVSAQGQAKPLLTSHLFSLTNVLGIYCPFTFEANVNMDQPALELPFCAAHEGAHQRGVAREDEANFIAYLAGRDSADPEFAYSANLFALETVVGALRRADAQAAAQVLERYSDAMRRDILDRDAYWKQFEGKPAEIHHQVNDAYLKQNGQEDGTRSYGRMVDLIIAERRAAIQAEEQAVLDAAAAAAKEANKK